MEEYDEENLSAVPEQFSAQPGIPGNPSFAHGSLRRLRDRASQYEYLVLTVETASLSGKASLRQVQHSLSEHAEYGKWELRRSLLYRGGRRQFWMRRKVLNVERTA